jgi:uncharacterized protein
MRGLIGRMEPASGAALLLPEARTIHTFGMRYAISVAWLASDGRVVDVRRLAPRRVGLRRRRARHVLECAAGAAPGVGSRLIELPARSPGPDRRGEGPTVGTAEHQRGERAVSTSACKIHRPASPST